MNPPDPEMRVEGVLTQVQGTVPVLSSRIMPTVIYCQSGTDLHCEYVWPVALRYTTTALYVELTSNYRSEHLISSQIGVLTTRHYISH